MRGTVATNDYFATSIASFQSYQICHLKTLDGILPPLMPPPLEPNFLSLRCHFSGYGDDTSNSNSRWGCSIYPSSSYLSLVSTSMVELEDTKEELDRALYNALMNGDENEVIKLCKDIPEGPLYVMTIHNDTVLHMATYSKQSDLVLNLLEQLSETGHLSKLTHKNDAGNTILHKAV